MKKLIVHLISDASGQTVKYATKSALSQFNKIDVKEYHWPLIRSQKLLEECIDKVREKPGVVLYTISDHEIRERLKEFCKKNKLPCISVIGKIVKEISVYLGIDTEESFGYSHRFDDSYFDKVDAIDYTLRHDDGQMIQDLEEADVILIGPSRTSKTPTSVYLAYNGFKTANIPYVQGVVFPDTLEKIHYPLVVGLIINPAQLSAIRETRVNIMQLSNIDNYTNIKVVQEECLQVKRLCEKNQWPVIDVSRRSIEETAAAVMKLFYEHRKQTK
jgi:hypothetical protein